MAELGILLVSDLHAGPGNLWPELRTKPASKKHNKKASSIGPTAPHYSLGALLKSAMGLLKQVPAERRVLLCAGDLSSGCHSEEFRATATFLTGLAEGLSVPVDARLVLPGNHDLDWPLTKLAAKVDPWYDGYRQRKLTDALAAHAPHFHCPSDGKLCVVRLLGGKVAFFLLDSAHEDRVQNTPHRGKVGATQLSALDAELAASSESLRIVALHHHLVPYAPGHGISAPDFSLVEDAGDLRRVLERNSVPFAFHGHQHYPFFQEVATSAVPLSVVSCGSTTQSADHLPPQIPNTFHVVIFDDLDPRRPRGVIHSRMLAIADGWRLPSYKHHHVAARKPFGAPLDVRQQEEWADEALDRCVEHKLVHIEPFLQNKPDGAYVCPHAFSEILRLRIAKRDLGSTLSVILDAESDRPVLQIGPPEEDVT